MVDAAFDNKGNDGDNLDKEKEEKKGRKSNSPATCHVTALQLFQLKGHTKNTLNT